MKLWHKWAIKMRADGATINEIAAKFGKSYSTVTYAICPRQRENNRNRVRRHRSVAKFMSDPMFKDREWVAWLRQP